MRRNFDYVSMRNYSSDMDELGKLAANTVKSMRDERDQWRRFFWAAVGIVRRAIGNAKRSTVPRCW